MELRLILIEEGYPDRTEAYRFSREELADMKPIARNPFAQALASERDKMRDPKAIIIAVGKLLSANIADYRDDRAGLNGERRQDIIAGKRA